MRRGDLLFTIVNKITNNIASIIFDIADIQLQYADCYNYVGLILRETESITNNPEEVIVEGFYFSKDNIHNSDYGYNFLYDYIKKNSFK